MARAYTGRNESEKSFIKAFNSLSYRHNPWTVWCDFVNMSACSIANAVDREEKRWKEREDSYLARAKTYTEDELHSFSDLLGMTVMALEQNPRQDFLGTLYMNLDFGNDWTGQFFTPWSVSEMMARMLFDENPQKRIDEQGYITVNDPACGAGCMLLAFAQLLLNEYKINYQQSVLFTGQDLDPVVAQMCYIQLSLLGCPGYVVIGDTLARPTEGSALLPAVHPDNLIWFTPMWFMPPWPARRTGSAFRQVFNKLSENAQ